MSEVETLQSSRSRTASKRKTEEEKKTPKKIKVKKRPSALERHQEYKKDVEKFREVFHSSKTVDNMTNQLKMLLKYMQRRDTYNKTDSEFDEDTLDEIETACVHLKIDLGYVDDDGSPLSPQVYLF